MPYYVTIPARDRAIGATPPKLPLPLLVLNVVDGEAMERKRGTEEGSEQAYKKARRDDSDGEYAGKTIHSLFSDEAPSCMTHKKTCVHFTLRIHTHRSTLIVVFFPWFFQTAVPHMTDSVMVAAIEEEATPDPVHAHTQGRIPLDIIAQDLGLAQGPPPPIAVDVLGLDHVHGQDQGLAQTSVEGGPLLGGGGDRRRGRQRETP